MKKINFKKLANKQLLGLKKKARKPNGSSKSLTKNADKMATKMTKPEREMDALLKELKINFEPQKVIGNKIFDFYVNDSNLIIEVDGDYWHANSEKYAEEDLNSIQKRNIKNDKFKETLALGRGYKIIRFWESEIHNDIDKVKSEIKKQIGL